MRDTFNKSHLPEQIEKGLLGPVYLRDAHLRQERRGEKLCTRAQMIRYLDADGVWIVEVFQYLRSDGSLGASGRQGPKRMRVGNEVWFTHLDDDPPPPDDNAPPR